MTFNFLNIVNDKDHPGSKYLLDSSREYAIYVCDTRGIPLVLDGMKEAQRTALWLVRNRAEKLKTFALTGLMGYEKLYHHGEASANNMIGLLCAPFKNNIPLLEGLGQFGNRVAPVEGIGAPRYTEIRRAKAAEKLLYADLNLVPLKDNYDGSNYLPVHFLPLVPLVLLNGIKGVAVGWSTEILPHDLKALINATQDALTGNKIKSLPPKFDRYATKIEKVGDNQWAFYGSCEIVNTTTIRITELPPMMTVEQFRRRLISMEEEKQFVTFADRSTENIDITVTFKRGQIKDWTEKDAITFFKLRETTKERIVVVGSLTKVTDAEEQLRKAQTPEQRNDAYTALKQAYTTISQYSSPEDLIYEFVNWRLGWYTNRYQKLVKDDNYELLYWKCIDALFTNKFTQRLGKFGNKADVVADVTKVATAKKINVDDTQIEKIVNLATYKWTVEFSQDVKNKIAELEKNIKLNVSILKSPTKLKQVYISELEELKKIKF